ncbi:hypothetical protein PRV_00395 [Mycoplasma parvum str. Indiana]|uniref:Uncharacterized protein n=2 Tax=Mycoplasma parvum TaxID=984991 RepID=U5NFE0_9MOLU|nr:hypothetical protein PRV_00395 [Mycoplasma parvum str. Indiana]
MKKQKELKMFFSNKKRREWDFEEIDNFYYDLMNIFIELLNKELDEEIEELLVNAQEIDLKLEVKSKNAKKINKKIKNNIK